MTFFARLAAYFKERLPFADLWHKLMIAYRVPRTLNLWYAIGAVLLFLLLLQAASGFLLAMHYEPSAKVDEKGVPLAFLSISHLIENVPWGWLWQTIHAQGASAFFILLYLHLFKAVLYGTYRAPREWVWCFGIALFVLFAGFAMSGDILLMESSSLAAWQVFSSLTKALPLIGQTLFDLFGMEGAHLPLNRVFLLHILLLPASLVFLLFLHLASSRKQGLSVAAKTPEKDLVPFFPWHFAKDLLAVIGFLVLFAIALFFLPDLIGIPEARTPANPLLPTPELRPLWFLSPFYAILRYAPALPFGDEVIDLSAFWLFLALFLPLLLPKLDRSASGFAQTNGGRVFLAIWALAFLWLGASSFWQGGFLERFIALPFAIYFGFFAILPWVSLCKKKSP